MNNEVLTKIANINKLAQLIAKKRQESEAVTKQASLDKQAYVKALAQHLANRKALAKTAACAVQSIRSR